MTVSPFSTHYYTERKKQFFARRSSLPLRHDILWLIETGVVRSLTFHEDRTSRTLGLWGSGDIVGKILCKSNSYQIECLTPVVATLLPKQSWYHGDESMIVEAMILHIQRSGELIEILQTRQAESSLFQLLAWLAKRFGQQIEQGQLIDLRLTHHDLADILGLTRVTVTRLLNTFEKHGVIERLSRKFILLHDQSPFWHYEI